MARVNASCPGASSSRIQKLLRVYLVRPLRLKSTPSRYRYSTTAAFTARGAPLRGRLCDPPWKGNFFRIPPPGLAGVRGNRTHPPRTRGATELKSPYPKATCQPQTPFFRYLQSLTNNSGYRYTPSPRAKIVQNTIAAIRSLISVGPFSPPPTTHFWF